MQYYYGLVDTVNLGYGFVAGDDERITSEFIPISEEYYNQLLEEQTNGKEIVCYDGQVFTADVGKYYVDNTGVWQVRSDEEIAQEQAQAEAKRVAMLNLTGADVERAIYKAKGMDFDDILTLVEAQPVAEDGTPTIDLKALRIELKANNFYRGNPYIEQVGALLGFTSDMLDKFFETNDYKYLKGEN